MPLLHSRVTKKTYQAILSKVEGRLPGWNVMRLSVVGMITLAQSIVQAILVFFMQTAKLQMGITSKIEQICMRFVWSGTNEHNKMGMVKWSKVCKPNNFGGLGFKKFEGNEQRSIDEDWLALAFGYF